MLDDNRVFVTTLVVGYFVAYALGAAMALLIHRRRSARREASAYIAGLHGETLCERDRREAASRG